MLIRAYNNSVIPFNGDTIIDVNEYERGYSYGGNYFKISMDYKGRIFNLTNEIKIKYLVNHIIEMLLRSYANDDKVFDINEYIDAYYKEKHSS